MKYLLVILVFLAACDKTEETARAEFQGRVGEGVGKCISVPGYKQKSVTFCSDGHILVVCSGSDCFTVEPTVIVRAPVDAGLDGAAEAEAAPEPNYKALGYTPPN